MTDIYDIDFELRRAVNNMIETLSEEYDIPDEYLDIIERHFMAVVDAVNDELYEMQEAAE